MFLALLKSVPGLEERLMNTESDEEIHSIAIIVSAFPLFPRLGNQADRQLLAAKRGVQCQI